ncbi:ParB/RepB/Spo0J family partition protein [Halorhodospira halochloris]|uniref:Probable chromosome-partitioning protein ParB n=1 Tax=Halorhodospira halochloris TaxID=1052 RepID=A0A120MZK6_HALHR|nr:ParB/RepB/Spo0J family partition protein [Halorhodospira halochloris]MBK1650840.1 chromosome partitioning protein ParB [Halorhodospira halochloris]MCG5530280.1 ParB/RepB/Spo0J family partition protein [Halorhodospira halochloris]BAU56663.1 chromosome (plasmid) partitioning protein ParB [Halorhodospira halochloris]
MGSKKRGLGRGLDALLSAEQGEDDAIDEDVEESVRADDTLREAPIDLLHRGEYQPRRAFDENALEELADSIRVQGVLQPLVVRPRNDGDTLEIIAGERRWRAAQLAGLDTVPVIVREITDEAAIAVGLIENLQREDLNPLEAAHALQRLIHEFGLSHQATAEAVGRSRTSITNLLRLLDLNDDVQNLIMESALDVGHAKVIAGLHGREQSEAAAKVVKDNLTVRQTESLVRKMLAAKKESNSEESKAGEAANKDPDVERLQEKLTEKLGTEVDIMHSKRKGKGRLVIRYSSLEELDGILGRIN